MLSQGAGSKNWSSFANQYTPYRTKVDHITATSEEERLQNYT